MILSLAAQPAVHMGAGDLAIFIVLKNGCLEDEGRLEDLLERSQEMRRLWRADGI